MSGCRCWASWANAVFDVTQVNWAYLSSVFQLVSQHLPQRPQEADQHATAAWHLDLHRYCRAMARNVNDGAYAMPGFLLVPANGSRARFVGYRPSPRSAGRSTDMERRG